jgi:polyhydroxyalkanoate synthase
VINPPSKGRGYRTNARRASTPEKWLQSAERHDGSWWTDWVAWLRPRTGEAAPPPGLGSENHPPLVAAPGSYVLEK